MDVQSVCLRYQTCEHKRDSLASFSAHETNEISPWMLHFPFQLRMLLMPNLAVLQTGLSVAVFLLLLLKTDESLIKAVAIGAMSQN